MRIRTALALSSVALVGAATLASASPAGSSAAPPPVVTITHDDGGTQIRTGLPGQPLVSVGTDRRGLCAGFSYQMDQCVPVSLG